MKRSTRSAAGATSSPRTLAGAGGALVADDELQDLVDIQPTRDRLALGHPATSSPRAAPTARLDHEISSARRRAAGAHARSHAVAALRYARLGWPVLPLHTATRDGSCSCPLAACSKPGKHPRARHGLHDATTDQTQIRSWWTTWPQANIGVATGSLFVVDADGLEGRDALARLQRAHAALPRTLEASTGRGVHLYFHAPSHVVGNSAGLLGPGLDVRGRGGYVVVPPSRHAAGHRYRWRTHRPPAPAPTWLVDLLTAVSAPAPRTAPAPVPHRGDRASRYFQAALRAELADVAAAPTGTRNDTLNRAAFRLAQLAASGHAVLDDLHAPLLDAALAAGLTEPEALATIASGLSAGHQHPRHLR